MIPIKHEPFPPNFHLEDITKGYIISKETYDKFLINPNLPNIYDDDMQFLIIYAIYPKLTRITCYPITPIRIFKIKIQLLDANHLILSKITVLLANNQTIHTTGLSQKEEIYVVENYLVLSQKWTEIQSLVEQINKIPEVKHSQIIMVKFQKS